MLKRRPGRQTTDPETHRNAHIGVMVKEETKVLAKAMADRSGVSLSTWVAHLIEEAVRRD